MGKINPKVKLTWCGAEPTLVAAIYGGEKFKVKPGEEFECEYRLAENYIGQGNFLVEGTKKEVDELIKKNKDGLARLKNIEKLHADARNKSAKKVTKKKNDEASEEDLESVEEEEIEETEDDAEVESEEEQEEEEVVEDEVKKDEKVEVEKKAKK